MLCCNVCPSTLPVYQTLGEGLSGAARVWQLMAAQVRNTGLLCSVHSPVPTHGIPHRPHFTQLSPDCMSLAYSDTTLTCVICRTLDNRAFRRYTCTIHTCNGMGAVVSMNGPALEQQRTVNGTVLCARPQNAKCLRTTPVILAGLHRCTRVIHL